MSAFRVNFAKYALASAIAVFAIAGCASHPAYYAPPPPPAYYAPPPPQYGIDLHALVQAANDNGFRDGYNDGVRDRDTGHSFRPRHNGKFRDCPGYYSAMGPHDQYVFHYREKYERGYGAGYQRGQ